jgi:hypothetical protein
VRRSRRAALRILALGGGAAVVTACTPTAPATAPSATTAASSAVTAAPTAATEQPRTGGTLRFGTSADLLTLDGQDFSSGGEGLLGV